MKFNKVGQVSLVSAIALILASAFTACNPVTIDYVFVAGNKESPGQIQTFLVDRVSGALSIGQDGFFRRSQAGFRSRLDRLQESIRRQPGR
jgi:hypothetical protein